MVKSEQERANSSPELSRILSSLLLLVLGLSLGWLGRSCAPAPSSQTLSEEAKASSAVTVAMPTPTPVAETLAQAETQELTLKAPALPPPEASPHQATPEQRAVPSPPQNIRPPFQPRLSQSGSKPIPPTEGSNPRGAGDRSPPASVVPSSTRASVPQQAQPKPKKTVTPRSIPEPSYPVYKAERIPRDQHFEPGFPAASSAPYNEHQESEPDEQAYPIYAPAIFIDGRCPVPHVVVEFELFPDASFYVSLLQGTGRGDYDALAIDTLRDWEWEPARRHGKRVASIERLRISRTQLPREEWERQRAAQERETQRRRGP